MLSLEPFAIGAIFLAFALGGILKGATGAGTPVVAIPVMAAFLDVRLAVVLMVLPNFVTNFWQVYQYWNDKLGPTFWWKHAIAGFIGAVVGTWLLAILPTRVLLILVAVAIVAYIGLRVARPDFKLAMSVGNKLAVPMGLCGGVLQGASGISAPVSVSFLNAMRLERPVFISTISVFFGGMTVAQIPAQFAAGLMTVPLLAISVVTLIPTLTAWYDCSRVNSSMSRVISRLLVTMPTGLRHSANTSRHSRVMRSWRSIGW